MILTVNIKAVTPILRPLIERRLANLEKLPISFEKTNLKAKKKVFRKILLF